MDEGTYGVLLKAIETVGSEGEIAGWVLLFWVGKGYFSSLLLFTSFLLLVYAGYRVFLVINEVDTVEIRKLVKEIRKDLNLYQREDALAIGSFQEIRKAIGRKPDQDTIYKI